MKQAKVSPVLAAPGGATIQRRGLVVSNSIPRTTELSSPARLSDLRRQYNSAILAKDWAAAERLQRAYHAAERERRRELLQQAAARGAR